MQRRIAICLAVAATALLALTGGTATADPSKPPGFASLLAKAEAHGSVAVIAELDSLGAQSAVLSRLENAEASVRTRYELLPFLALEVGPEALRLLAASPEIVGLRENKPEPPLLDQTIPLINADDVQALGFDGTGQAVAILDTGIDRDHPFFAGRLVAEACFSTGGGTGGTSLCPDGTGAQTGGGSADAETANCFNGAANICDHGSHVAGIAAGDGTGVAGAPATGVAPEAGIVAIQVFSRFNTAASCNPNPAPCVLSWTSDQILGLQQVLAVSATTTIAAANMSLGGGNNAAACDGDARKTAIDALLGAGIATVISSGNNGFNAAVGAPGCISTAVTVGATNDADGIAGFSNIGTLLDLFAPGVGVNSSIVDDVFGNKNGTSMAAPHVTGAFAVLRDAYPTATIAELLTLLQTTGVLINYVSAGSNVTTPRIDLFAALQAGTDPPSLTADDATVTVDEGSTAANTGTFSDPDGDPVTLSASVGTVIDAGGGNWSWSFDTNDGPTQSQTVTITGTDDKAVEGSVTFALVVDNVAPVVLIDPAQDTTIDEGDTLAAAATFTDPGWADTYSSVIDWGTGDSTPGLLLVTSPGPPVDAGAVNGSFQYGDDGSFTVTVDVTDDDGGTGSDFFSVSVANVAPTATIDETGTVIVNGVPTYVVHEGDVVPFSGNSTDPGSDDLTLAWDYDGGGTDVSTVYLNDAGLGPDPDPSPSVNPRNVTDSQPFAFGDACFYTSTFTSSDDDGGSASDEVQVIVAGNASDSRGAGYWQTQYRPRPTSFSEERRLCYLAIAGFMSTVFDELRSAATVAQAFDVMHVGGSGGDASQQLDRQLLAAWLNFANGAFDLAEAVDTDGDGVADATFAGAVAAAEAVRSDPSATAEQLLAQRDILERING